MLVVELKDNADKADCGRGIRDNVFNSKATGTIPLKQSLIEKALRQRKLGLFGIIGG